MATKNKIFTETDFNKKKQLFTSQDFEKVVVNEKDSKNKPITSKLRIWLWSFSIIAIIFIVIFCMKNSFSDEKLIIEADEKVESLDTTFAQKIDDITDFEDKITEETVVIVQNVADEKTKLVNVAEDADQPIVTEKQDSFETNTSIHSIETVYDKSLDVIDNLEEKALRTIRGDFGNGKERKEKLGSEYSVIQNKVNEMYREGLVRQF